MKNIRLTFLSVFLSVIFLGYSGFAEDSSFANVDYYEHIYKIGLVEEYAAKLLMEYEEDINSFSVPDIGMTRLRNTLKNFKILSEEHRNINIPSRYGEFHDLLTTILKTHTSVFRDLLIGLTTKDKAVINSMLVKYKESDAEEIKNKLFKKMEQISKESDEYTIKHIEEKIGRKTERDLNAQ